MQAHVGRAAVVAAAREWIGTPYHHMADVKGVGCDCAMLLVRVYCDLGLVPPFDPRPYVRDWHLHRSEERYLDFLLARARQTQDPRPADIVVFPYGRCFSHGGIVTRANPLTIVHAFHPVGLVLEEEAARNAQLAARLPRALFATHWSAES